MNFKKNLQTNFLKHTINTIWYVGLAVGIFLVITVFVFNIAVISNWNIKFPTISIWMNDHTYQFNTKYVEVRRLYNIESYYMGKEFFKETLKKSSTPLYRKAKESLYNITLTAPKSVNWDSIIGNPPTALWMIMEFRKEHYTQEKVYERRGVDYALIRYFPFFYISLSAYITLIVLFSLIIIFNTRKIFLTIFTNSVFTKGNAVRIKFIAIYTLLAEFVRLFTSWWINYSSGSRYPDIPFSFFLSWKDIHYELIFIGIILLLISAILQSGSSIKEEIDLTV
ncbi:MAG: DUF2975 domain-containing protein [Ignavibacteriales bacterium]|nr:DUF2975 domain-containing protein [Ignavibacteriales bacterium]